METCPKFRFLFLLLTFFPADAEWVIAPRKLYENHDYRGLEYIARIRSDKENFTKVIYSLHGPGVDEPPFNIFGINSQTGYVKIYAILDREKISSYQLKGVATFINGSRAETDIPLPITVLDENDCAPVIQLQTGSVKELSTVGTVVMRVIATDADQANTLHSQMFYSILQESNSGGMFGINARTGEVTVLRNTLDRETKDTYRLTIRAADLNGQAGGNVGMGTIEIKILDINDNIPTLEKEFYEASVEENTMNVEVLRIKAIDYDLEFTENWMAVYEITDGNQAGYFTITTDSKTNEGVIMIQKALDYEELKVVNLEVSVRNKAEYNFGSFGGGGGGGGGKSYPIKINVINQKEGPRFQPSVKVVTISEDHSSVTLHSIISRYAAIDTDTGLTATNVRYAKIYDEDNWLIIDEQTADIKLNKWPDRESKFLINGTYYSKIICITNDSPSKTATGTIAIQVEDFNDHCPELTTTVQTLCFEDSAVYATALDKDEFPNSAPFVFTVIESKSSGKWTVEPLNATTVILRDNANLWPGVHKVGLDIRDQQGKSCGEAEVMDVIVCKCKETTKTCSARTTKTFELGPSGILMLLLPLLLLLLLPLLLLFCLCGGASGLADFKAIPFETKQQLISYHTEGQGEDKEIPLLNAVEVDGGGGGGGVVTKDVNALSGGASLGGGRGGGGGGMFGGGMHTSTWTENMDHHNQYSFYRGEGHRDFSQGGTLGHGHYLTQSGAGVFDGMALSLEFLEDYYLSKANYVSRQNEQKDAFKVYDYEGQESLAGSVGCCSLLENEDDLSFLNDLGPKFKKLANICQGSAIVTDTVDTGIFISSPKLPVSPVIPSPTHTHLHTHSETVRDREHISLNSSHVPGTSHIAGSSHLTGTSTLIKEQSHPGVCVSMPTQTLLIQQPTMYYAATPMYVVEPKPQVVLVAGGAQQAVGQVGGLVQVGGLQSSQGVVLVDRQVGSSASGQSVRNATTSRSQQVIVVEEGGVRERGTHRVVHSGQGLAVAGQGQGAVSSLSGGVGVGSSIQSGGINMTTSSHGGGVRLASSSHGGGVGLTGSAGSIEVDFGLTTVPRAQGSQRVVVHHKKVSVTESRA
ncbi:unnamed protein product [Knipowitschia caucasica]|uniref:Cadherin domain-containing protein n=1 Tax=Knipowitschia caucasica TaxID=637954 RepID=A0AAV2JPF9_KNICA